MPQFIQKHDGCGDEMVAQFGYAPRSGFVGFVHVTNVPADKATHPEASEVEQPPVTTVVVVPPEVVVAVVAADGNVGIGHEHVAPT